MNMPDVDALQEIMSEMGEMDYEELKKRKRGGMPGMTKVEIESNQPIDAQKIAEAMKSSVGGQISEMEAQKFGQLTPTGDMESDEEKKRRLMEMLRRRSGAMGSDREMEMMGR